MESKYKFGQVVKAPTTKSIGSKEYLDRIKTKYLTISEIRHSPDTARPKNDDKYNYYFKELSGKGGFSSYDIDKTNKPVFNEQYPIF